jgi:REP-associated tyrosine transposase
MPRLACPEEPGVALHLVQRGCGRAPCFSGARDRLAYLEALRECAARSACAVHAYALMGNHVHLLVTPAQAGGASRLIRRAADRYGRHLAEAYGHEGPVWEERFDGSPVRVRRYLLACMLYIELNPVRAGLVRKAGAYRWSSYRANAEGGDDALVTPHPGYCALGRSRKERCAAYRSLFEDEFRDGHREQARELNASSTSSGAPRPCQNDGGIEVHAPSKEENK